MAKYKGREIKSLRLDDPNFEEKFRLLEIEYDELRAQRAYEDSVKKRAKGGVVSKKKKLAKGGATVAKKKMRGGGVAAKKMRGGGMAKMAKKKV